MGEIGLGQRVCGGLRLACIRNRESTNILSGKLLSQWTVHWSLLWSDTCEMLEVQAGKSLYSRKFCKMGLKMN